MARSTVIYVIMDKGDRSLRIPPYPMRGFTVKHELISTVKRLGWWRGAMEIWRVHQSGQPTNITNEIFAIIDGDAKD